MLIPEIDKPHPEKQGAVVYDRMWTYQELELTLAFVLKRAGLYDELDYFQTAIFGKDMTENLPKELNRIVVYAVEGANEGHYVHVDLQGKGCTGTVVMGKTFLGWEHALKVSNVLSSAIYSDSKEYVFSEPATRHP